MARVQVGTVPKDLPARIGGKAATPARAGHAARIVEGACARNFQRDARMTASRTSAHRDGVDARQASRIRTPIAANNGQLARGHTGMRTVPRRRRQASACRV
jgi:hypothetical protein